MNRRNFHRNAIRAAIAANASRPLLANAQGWSIRNGADRMSILRDGRPIATYVTRHPKIRRPFFQDIYTPGGMRATRPLPPDPNAEDTDHDTMHPGLWLAFGDLNGLDYWRNKAEIRHIRFVEQGTAENDRLFFETENHYLDAAGANVICREIARFEFRMVGRDFRLDWTSTLSTDLPELRFGHQEEMGLGLRLTRPLTVKKGEGRIDCSNGGVDEKGTWGQKAQWWAASVPGLPDPTTGNSTRRGIRIQAVFEPGDRPFWGHTRDYGLIVANPTPRPGAGVDSISIPSKTPVVFRFRIRLFDAAAPDFAAGASEEKIESR